MAYTEEDLLNVIKSTIKEIQDDPDLSYMYSNVSKWATCEPYLNKIATMALYLILEEGLENIFDALAQIEYQFDE
jgi:predicted regulator of amino acid metabolism with ACT domain